jgi:fructose-1,6-bisphosphatase
MTPDPEPAYVRVLRRVSEKIGPDAVRTGMCPKMREVLEELTRETVDYLNRRQYSDGYTSAYELWTLSRIYELLCVPTG